MAAGHAYAPRGWRWLAVPSTVLLLAWAMAGSHVVREPARPGSLPLVPARTFELGGLARAEGLPPLPSPPPAAPTTPVRLLADLHADLAATWLKNHRQTPLRAGPGDQAPRFNDLPQWSLLRLVERRGDWLLVQYGGDGATRQAGPGWVRAADVGPVGTPAPWLATTRPALLWSAPDAGATPRLSLPAGIRVEVVRSQPSQGTRVQVRLPGDGRLTPPAQGWAEAADLRRIAPPSRDDLPWAFPASVRAEVRLPVPYRTQLDGSRYAAANCGPTAIGMVLEFYGVKVQPADLRAQVLEAQEMDPADVDEGSFVWALGKVLERYDLRASGLYEADGSTLHRWTVSEVRERVRRGTPVILQVRFRALPGRAASPYYGDHFIVVTGLLGDRFLYDDPIGGTPETQGPGWDRVMTAEQLERAMDASDHAYAYSGFAVAAGGRSMVGARSHTHL